MRHMAKHAPLILILGVLWSGTLEAAPPEGFGRHPEDLRIQLVTFGPGKDAHQLFGHSALWIEDTRLGADVLYNYGVTSYGRGSPFQPLMEQQTYWAARLPVESTFFLYRELDRSISVQELHLTAEQRQRLFERLERDVKPENRYYKYHHSDDNCATRLRDALDEALGGALRSELTGPARLSQREHLRRFSLRNPVLDMLLMSWLNDSVDVPMTRWQETFLPVELSRALEGVTYADGAGGRVRLVGRSHALHRSSAEPVPEAPEPLPLGALLIGVSAAGLAAVLAYLRRRSGRRLFRVLFGLYHALFGLTLGSVGVAGFVLTVFSELTVMHGNESQLMVNPLTFALLPLGILMALGSERAERLARLCVYALVLGSLLAVVLKVLPAFDQDTRVPMSLLLVANLGLGAAHALLRRPVPAASLTRRQLHLDQRAAFGQVGRTQAPAACLDEPTHQEHAKP